MPDIRYRSIVCVTLRNPETDGAVLENREIVDSRRYDPIIVGVVSRDTWVNGISFQDPRIGLHDLMVAAIGFRESAGGRYKVSSRDIHQYFLLSPEIIKPLLNFPSSSLGDFRYKFVIDRAAFFARRIPFPRRRVIPLIPRVCL